MTIYRVETIPPPDGEDPHEKETRIGDPLLARELACEQEERVSSAATTKVSAFDLDAALAMEAARRADEPAAPAPASRRPPPERPFAPALLVLALLALFVVLVAVGLYLPPS